MLVVGWVRQNYQYVSEHKYETSNIINQSLILGQNYSQILIEIVDTTLIICVIVVLKMLPNYLQHVTLRKAFICNTTKIL